MKMFNFNSSRRRRWMAALALLAALLLLLAFFAGKGKGTNGPGPVNEPTVVPGNETPTSSTTPTDNNSTPNSQDGSSSTGTNVAPIEFKPNEFEKGRSFQVEFAQIQPPRADVAHWNLLKKEVYNFMTVTGSLEYRGFLGGGVGPKDDVNTGGVMVTPVVETEELIYTAEISIAGSGIQGIEHYISNDGGASWQRIDLSQNPSGPIKIAFSKPGNGLQYKAVWPSASRGLLVEISIDINTFYDISKTVRFTEPVRVVRLKNWSNLPPGAVIYVNNEELGLSQNNEIILREPSATLDIRLRYDAQGYFAPPAGPAAVELVAE